MKYPFRPAFFLSAITMQILFLVFATGVLLFGLFMGCGLNGNCTGNSIGLFLFSYLIPIIGLSLLPIIALYLQSTAHVRWGFLVLINLVVELGLLFSVITHFVGVVLLYGFPELEDLVGVGVLSGALILHGYIVAVAFFPQSSKKLVITLMSYLVAFAVLVGIVFLRKIT